VSSGKREQTEAETMVSSLEAAEGAAGTAADGEAVSPAPSIALGAGKVQMVPIEDIDLADEAYMFRAALRTGPLEESIKAQGIQVPIVLRAKDGRKGPKFQLICGFRRTTAARNAGLTEVPAVVRMLTDEEAYRVSVLENSNRKTYSDIDKAIAIRGYEARGYTGTDIAGVLGLNERQQRNVKSLLKLPPAVQEAVDDPEQPFQATHAITLRALLGDGKPADYLRWVKRVNDEQLSVAQLKKEFRKAAAKKAAPGFVSLFQPKQTDLKAGEVRFSPVKVEIGKLTPTEKVLMKAELEKLLKLLG
jgi:ParB family chromosome partitioning protein